MKIALDAMGGDHAPQAIVEGGVAAAREEGLTLIFVGHERIVAEELEKHDTRGLQLEVHHAPQKVEMHEKPAAVIRKKRDSSIWIATDLVKKGHADAVISAGNTGAAMATALFLLGALRGVERPAIATFLPTLRGQVVILDVGANVDCRPHHLFQFAIMGCEYAKRVLGKNKPAVGLLSIGEEDTKGNEVTKEAFRLLKESPLHFVGNVEGKDVYSGQADVVVCDGFIGNVALKISEGLAEATAQLLKREIAATPFGKIGYFFLRSAFSNFKKKVDYAEYGGAPLLGVNGVCIICHGRSSAKAVKNAIKVAASLVKRKVTEHIQKDMEDILPHPIRRASFEEKGKHQT